jgi:hypothetical protein
MYRTVDHLHPTRVGPVEGCNAGGVGVLHYTPSHLSAHAPLLTTAKLLAPAQQPRRRSLAAAKNLWWPQHRCRPPVAAAAVVCPAPHNTSARLRTPANTSAPLPPAWQARMCLPAATLPVAPPQHQWQPTAHCCCRVTTHTAAATHMTFTYWVDPAPAPALCLAHLLRTQPTSHALARRGCPCCSLHGSRRVDTRQHDHRTRPTAHLS